MASNTNKTAAASAEVMSHLQDLQYVSTACLTVCAWEWVMALADEYDIICRNGKRWVGYLLFVLYLISRAGAIVCLIAALVPSAPTVDTAPATIVMAVAKMVTIPAISGIFYARLSAVYAHNKAVMAFFGAWWLGIFGCFLVAGINMLSKPNQPNMIEHQDAWGFIANLIYDTLIYLAISWQLASFSVAGDSWKYRLRSFIHGDGLFRFSKALLHSGQVYYFMTIGFSICTVVFLLNPVVGPHWTPLFVPLNMTVASVMACRLFRQLKLSLANDTFTDSKLSDIMLAESHALAQLGDLIFEPDPLDETATVNIYARDNIDSSGHDQFRA